MTMALTFKSSNSTIFMSIIVTILLLLSPLSTFATLSVVSETTNETVFSTEEAGIDSASAYKLSGHLVIASPQDACTTVDAPPPMNKTAPPPHSYVLVATVVSLSETAQDDCSLAKKAKNAQAAGYAGLVLIRIGSNDTSSIIPQFIGLDWLGVRIYACVVGDQIGKFLMQNYVYPSRYYVRFENEPYYPIGLLTNFVVIGILVVLTVLLLLKLFHYFYFSVTTRVVERRRIRKTLLSVSQLGKLPVLRWTPSIPQDTCSICIEQFEAEAEIRVLPCSHVFHKLCIDPWLLKESRKCPNCKGRVLFPNERGYIYSSDSEGEEAESGDERTPLLRPRENYRFIETLTESHNSRTLHHDQDQYHQYLQEDPVEEVEVLPPVAPRKKSNTTKVTFAPAISVMSSCSSSGSDSTNTNIGRRPSADITNAFVLPMGPGPRATITQSTKKSMLKSPLRRIVINQNPISISETSTTTVLPGDLIIQPPPPGLTSAEQLSPCSSTSSDQTLIDFYDIPIPAESEPVEEKEASLTTSNASFHSCEGFESEFPSLDGKEGGTYGSFQSSSSSGSYHA